MKVRMVGWREGGIEKVGKELRSERRRYIDGLNDQQVVFWGGQIQRGERRLAYSLQNESWTGTMPTQ